MTAQRGAPAGGPVFITGLDRTGKTWLRSALDAHPDLALSRTGLWTRHYGRHGDLREEAAVDRCLAAIAAMPRARHLLPDTEEWREEFDSGSRTYSRLFALLHVAHARRLGKPRWGVQDADVEFHARRVLAELPSARVLHLVRDPRRRYAELVAHEGRRAGRIGSATASWLASAWRGLRNAARYPHRYRLLRIEAIEEQPEAALGELCSLLGLEFTPELLRAAPERGGHPGARLRRGETVFIEAWAGRTMRQLGYASTLAMADLPRAVQPVALVRLAARGGRELCATVRAASSGRWNAA